MTRKQDRFVKEYLIDLNATQAAIRAGYSPKTANEQGARLLANVSVQEAIAKAMAERSKRTGISQALLEAIYNWMRNGGLYKLMIDVLTNGVELEFDNREIARLVKKYA